MFSINRNSYLQQRQKYGHARLINRCVDLARQQAVVLCFDSEPPFNRLCSQKPCIPVKNVDVTRRPVAFGRWALPKLRRELHSDDPDIVLKAIASISDLIHDPERAFEAIKLDIPKRMCDLINHVDPSVQEFVLLSYITLAGLEAGRNAIVCNENIMSRFLYILEEYPLFEIKIKVAKCLEIISRSWIGADYLVEQGFVPKILKLLHEEIIEVMISLYLEILHHLMYGEGKETALVNNAYGIFTNLLEKRNVDILKNTLDCLMLITSTVQGKILAQANKLLFVLEKVLKYENSKVDSNRIFEMKASAASVIMFCTIDTKAKIRASKMEELPLLLLKLAKVHYRTLQLYCFRALTNICEHWRPRKFVKDNFSNELAEITLVIDEQYRTDLLMVINWEPTSST